MGFKENLKDAGSAAMMRFWMRRAVGAAAVVASLISTYHRIQFDPKQVGEVADSVGEESGNRAPASIEAQNPPPAVAMPAMVPKRISTQTQAVADPDAVALSKTSDTTQISTTATFLRSIGAHSTVTTQQSTTSSATTASSEKPMVSVKENDDGSLTVTAPPGSVNASGGFKSVAVQPGTQAPAAPQGAMPSFTAPVVPDTGFLFSSIGFTGQETQMGPTVSVSASGVTAGTDPLLQDGM